MTGKRFTLKGLIEGVPNICDDDEIIEQEEAVDLLNELHEDNKQYKILIESLKKENQKLKLRLKDLGVEYY